VNLQDLFKPISRRVKFLKLQIQLKRLNNYSADNHFIIINPAIAPA
jgi:hypothetical protein